MPCRSSTRKYFHLLFLVLSLALTPSVLKAQTQGPSTSNSATQTDGSNGKYAVWTALISGLTSFATAGITAWLTAKRTSKSEISKGWDNLLAQETIEAIKDRGHFVREEEICKKLLMEVGSDCFKSLSGSFAEHGRCVIKGHILDALLTNETPDAAMRLWRWMQDDSRVKGMLSNTPENNEALLSDLSKALRSL